MKKHETIQYLCTNCSRGTTIIKDSIADINKIPIICICGTKMKVMSDEM